MGKRVFLAAAFWVLILMSAGVAPAEDEEPLSPLAIKTKNIVDLAYSYVVKHSNDLEKVQEALQKDPRFHDNENELYIFMHCYDEAKKEAICCGQGVRPELVGKNMWHLRTPNGRLLFHEIMLLIEQKGQGWIEYEWLNPFTKTIQTKRSYVRKIFLNDGQKAWIGSGYWKE